MRVAVRHGQRVVRAQIWAQDQSQQWQGYPAGYCGGGGGTTFYEVQTKSNRNW